MIENIQQLKKSKILSGSFRKIPGVKWWQLNITTGDIIEVKFDQVNAGYKAGVQNRIDQKQDVLYAPAINKRNAEKKFVKMVTELSAHGNIIKYFENGN